MYRVGYYVTVFNAVYGVLERATICNYNKNIGHDIIIKNEYYMQNID